ncbi:hypothetical protein LMG29542_07579 [Paraburkholderia humisilvae]|uniref:Uncharacterized protein n=1 Tax=Paraburkholderia humisilvae TaxID=627669 RepID=A0A6J5F5H0_9BURK|nr:hypothetical protein LMG29542_07579 [Paraburkholderia humisilvae]
MFDHAQGQQWLPHCQCSVWMQLNITPPGSRSIRSIPRRKNGICRDLRSSRSLPRTKWQTVIDDSPPNRRVIGGCGPLLQLFSERSRVSRVKLDIRRIAARRRGFLCSTTGFVTNRHQSENNRVEARQRSSGAHSSLSMVSASRPKLKTTASNINLKRPMRLKPRDSASDKRQTRDC